MGRPVVEWRVPALLAILRREGREASWLPIDALEVPAGLAALDKRLPDSPAQEMVFDLTNARGVVGIALYELARRRECAAPEQRRLVRVDWSDRRVRAISPDRTDAADIAVRVRLDEFLELHGKCLLGAERVRGSTGAFGQAAYRLAADLQAAQPLLEAVHRGVWTKPLRLRPGPETARLVEDLHETGLLRSDGHALFAADLRAFQFLHGRWLEEYLFEIADASGRFDDCASGLRFTWAGEREVANEIDFAGTAGGRATVASCKTGFRDAAAVMYELLSLAERAAGRSVVAVLATSEKLEPPARHRAAALGVRVVDAERLAEPERVLAALVG